MTSHVLSAAVTGISTKASSTAASSVGGFVTRAMIALDEGAIAAGQATRLTCPLGRVAKPREPEATPIADQTSSSAQSTGTAWPAIQERR